MPPLGLTGAVRALDRAAGRLTARTVLIFFYGVAGKYDLDRPVGLPLQCGGDGRVAFTGAGRMRERPPANCCTRR
jgi:hypothetical protein